MSEMTMCEICGKQFSTIMELDWMESETGGNICGDCVLSAASGDQYNGEGISTDMQDECSSTEYKLLIEHDVIDGDKCAIVTVVNVPDGMPEKIFRSYPERVNKTVLAGESWRTIDGIVDRTVSEARDYIESIRRMRESIPESRTITI